jgi:type I restriction enzyme M protein
VPKADIVARGYELSLNRYREALHEVVKHREPKAILADLAKLDAEIHSATKNLKDLLG